MTANPPKKGPDVMVIDDSLQMLVLVETLLKSIGATVETSQAPAKGIARVLERDKAGAPFNLVMLDIMMGEIDGHKAAKEIRDGGFKGGIVAMTACATGEGKRKSQDVGINAYFDKRVVKKALLQALLDQYATKT